MKLVRRATRQFVKCVRVCVFVFVCKGVRVCVCLGWGGVRAG